MARSPYLEYARALRDFLLVIRDSSGFDPSIRDLSEESFDAFLSDLQLLVQPGEYIF